MKIGDTMYYAQILIKPQVFEVLELKIQSIETSNPNDMYFTGINKDNHHTYLFGFKSINDTVFENRMDALEKVKDAESKYKTENKMEVEYEEY